MVTASVFYVYHHEAKWEARRSLPDDDVITSVLWLSPRQSGNTHIPANPTVWVTVKKKIVKTGERLARSTVALALNVVSLPSSHCPVACTVQLTSHRSRTASQDPTIAPAHRRQLGATSSPTCDTAIQRTKQ